MTSKAPISPEGKSLYFDLQADFGITKHMGGAKATDELLALCHIGESTSALEVGCGIGLTPCHIAKRYGCRVMGVDIAERMVERSKARAEKQGLSDRVEFRVADAQRLPFEDARFDMVISESVTAFVADKGRAVSEYGRVTRQGGYVGLNEVTWLKVPPPSLVAYISLIMAGADFLTAEGWRGLLENAGLSDIEVRSHKFDMRSQYRAEIRYLDLREYTRAWYRFMTQIFVNPAYRRFTRQIFSAPGNMFKFMDYIGSGLYVGRK